MLTPRLPRVERNNPGEMDSRQLGGLIIEDDSAVLDAYARGLWAQWQALEGHGEKLSKKYPKTTIKAAVVWLTGAFVDAEVPVPYEFFRLIGAIIKPETNASTSPVRAGSERAYWAAIEFEAQSPQPSLYAVAKNLRSTGTFPADHSQKTAEGIIRGWRNINHYQENVQLYRRVKLKRPLGES